MMSVWLARAARWSGVSPRTVASSGEAAAWIRKMTMFMQPMKLATCRGVSPDCNNKKRGQWDTKKSKSGTMKTKGL